MYNNFSGDLPVPPDQIDDLNPILHKEASHFPTESISVNTLTSI